MLLLRSFRCSGLNSGGSDTERHDFVYPRCGYGRAASAHSLFGYLAIIPDNGHYLSISAAWLVPLLSCPQWLQTLQLGNATPLRASNHHLNHHIGTSHPTPPRHGYHIALCETIEAM